MFMLLARPIKSPPRPIAPRLRAEEAISSGALKADRRAASGLPAVYQPSERKAAPGKPPRLRESISLPQLGRRRRT